MRPELPYHVNHPKNPHDPITSSVFIAEYN